MISQTNFTGWLLDEEFKKLIEKFLQSRIKEEVDVDGRNSYNAGLQDELGKMGLQHGTTDWYRFVSNITSNFAHGLEASTLAGDVMAEIIYVLSTKGISEKGNPDNLYNSVKEIINRPEESRTQSVILDLKNVIQTSAQKRAIRLIGKKLYGGDRRNKKTKIISMLDRPDSNYIANIPSNDRPPDEYERLESGKKEILDELKRIKNTKTDPRIVKQYELAIEVAEARMGKIHEPDVIVPFDELLSKFQDKIKSRGTMHNILALINKVANSVLLGIKDVADDEAA